MDERLAEIEAHYEQVEAEMAAPEVASDLDRLRDLGRAYAELGEIVAPYRELKTVREQVAEAREIGRDGADSEMATYLSEELERLDGREAQLRSRLEALLVPKDPDEGKDVIVEIRGGAGGAEAALWASDLFEMYRRLAERHRWKTDVIASSPSELGGFKEVSLEVRGKDAYGRLKYEAGVHRVQRVPVTESQGRIHTSTATVAVMPEAEDVEIQIEDKDLKIDVYRSTGPGGQSVNTTDSAVRITHLPTGIVVSMQDEKSQLQNKQKAMRVLRARLYEAERERQQAEVAAARRSQVGTGERAEKIRTYNFPENRLTDHRVKHTVHRLDQILDGDLEEFTETLQAEDRRRALEAAV